MIFYEDSNGNEVMFAEEFVTREVENMILMTAASREHERLCQTFKMLHDQEDALLAGTTQQQRDIQGGTYCRKTVKIPDLPEPLAIYGQVMSLDEIRHKEEQAGASQWHIDRVLQIFEDGRKQGWVHGVWFSVAAPEGDAGSQHIGELEVISREEFERARAAKWNLR